MGEEEAKLVLHDMFEDELVVQQHLQRIRMFNKVYWSDKNAKDYIEKLKKN